MHFVTNLPVFHESSVLWPSNTQIQRENDLFYEQQQHTYLKKKKRNNNIAFAIKVWYVFK